MRLAVIPARGGSKRIPRKNVLPFAGRPMIGWSIAAARAAGCFDAIVVSTDDDEIAEVARAQGAEVPFRRAAELADDHAGTMPVIADAIARLAALGRPASAVCCLYATAPLVQAGDLRRGLDLLQQHRADFALAVTSYAFPIQRAVTQAADGRLAMFQPEHFRTRSQDLAPAWHDAGQFCWGTPEAWCAGQPLFERLTVPVLLPRHRVQDIDTPEDWERAEWLARALAAQAQGQQPAAAA